MSSPSKGPLQGFSRISLNFLCRTPKPLNGHGAGARRTRTPTSGRRPSSSSKQPGSASDDLYRYYCNHCFCYECTAIASIILVVIGILGTCTPRVYYQPVLVFLGWFVSLDTFHELFQCLGISGLVCRSAPERARRRVLLAAPMLQQCQRWPMQDLAGRYITQLTKSYPSSSASGKISASVRTSCKPKRHTSRQKTVTGAMLQTLCRSSTGSVGTTTFLLFLFIDCSSYGDPAHEISGAA